MASRFFGLSAGLATATVVAVALNACSSDSGSPKAPSKDAGGDQSSSGGVGGKGSGGAGGIGGKGTGGASGAGGVVVAGPDAGPVSCGPNTCKGVPVLPGLLSLGACCVQTTKCGLDLTQAKSVAPQIPSGCVELKKPGGNTPQCPDADVTVVQKMHLKGCCRPAGVCGLKADVTSLVAGLDFGCVDPADWSVTLEGGPPKSCTPVDGGPAPTDGGTG